MGKVIESNCRTCQYQNQFNFGGSRFNFQYNKPVPALSLKTGEFENVNYHTYKSNLGYIFYSDGLLKTFSQDQTTFKDFDFEINEKSNYCPSCKSFTLDFRCVAYFD